MKPIIIVLFIVSLTGCSPLRVDLKNITEDNNINVLRPEERQKILKYFKDKRKKCIVVAFEYAGCSPLLISSYLDKSKASNFDEFVKYFRQELEKKIIIGAEAETMFSLAERFYNMLIKSNGLEEGK